MSGPSTRRAGLVKPGSHVPTQKPVVSEPSDKPFKIPKRFEADDDPVSTQPVEEVSDSMEEVSQELPPLEEAISEDEDPEAEFRDHAHEVLMEHGLEQVKGWFQLEFAKAKKALAKLESEQPAKKKRRT